MLNPNIYNIFAYISSTIPLFGNKGDKFIYKFIFN